MADKCLKGYRPHRFGSDQRATKVARKTVGAAELERRSKEGLDLWTGEPLTGLDRIQWNRLKHGVPEEDTPEVLAMVRILGLNEGDESKKLKATEMGDSPSPS